MNPYNVIFVFESPDATMQKAIALDLDLERALVESGWKHIASLDPQSYMIYHINNGSLKVLK